jgi:hypothetical protein
MGIETRALFCPEARMIENVGRFPYRQAEEQPGVKQKHPSRHSGHDAVERSTPETYDTAPDAVAISFGAAGATGSERAL